MRDKILYIHLGLSSFVQKDIDILSSEYSLKAHFFSVKEKKILFISLIKEFFFLLNNVRKSSVIVIQFAGYHSFLPVLFTKIFKIKTVIVLGGTDCVSFPSIQYGSHAKRILKNITSYSIRNASLLLPVDQSLVHYKYTYTTTDFSFQGYLEHVKKTTTPYKVLHNGYDDEIWKKMMEKEENSFVTVGGNLTSRFGFQLKGIDLIFAVAPFFSECKFYIVGGYHLKQTVPSNIILVDYIPNNELPVFLSSKKYYLQLSMSEGFPNALCEAMLCECIPIVSNVAAMPMIVGDSGYILKEKDLNLLTTLIKESLEQNFGSPICGEKYRKIIQDNYSMDKRSKEFKSTLKELIEKSNLF